MVGKASKRRGFNLLSGNDQRSRVICEINLKGSKRKKTKRKIKKYPLHIYPCLRTVLLLPIKIFHLTGVNMKKEERIERETTMKISEIVKNAQDEN